MSEERLAKLKIQFFRFNVYENYGITFEQYANFVGCGMVLYAIDNNSLPLVYRGRLEEVSL